MTSRPQLTNRYMAVIFRQRISRRLAEGMAVGFALESLTAAIAERLQMAVRLRWLELPAAAGALRAQLFAAGVVQQERTTKDGHIRLQVQLPAAEFEQLARRPGIRLLAEKRKAVKAACAPKAAYLESGAVPRGAALVP